MTIMNNVCIIKTERGNDCSTKIEKVDDTTVWNEEQSMKKTLSGLVTAVLTAGTVLLPFSGFLGTAAVSADETYESAWFPLRTMALTQISFESYSHGSSYHIDCSGRYEQCAFAPFTGKVVYTTSNYGLVLFQSLSPVHYADGSLDYMTVVFMHADNTAELEKKRVS